MTILVFGCSGARKKSALERLKVRYNFDHPDETVFLTDIGTYLGPLSNFLPRPPGDQRAALRTALRQCIDDTVSSRADLKFVSLHGTYFYAGNVTAPLSALELADFVPQAVVTLIDDAYAMKHRLRSGGYDFLFSELLIWRAVDIALVDNLTYALSVQLERTVENVVVAAKHPTEMLYRALFQPEIPRLYASFHITTTRGDPQARRAIDDVREELHRQYAVFDPVTIDDRILINSLGTTGEGVDDIEIPAGHRWDWRLPANSGNHFVPLVDDEEFFPVRVPVAEGRMLSFVSQSSMKNMVDAQITSRDFRYIHQSDCMAVFRPRFEGRTSIGVEQEIEYAETVAKIPVVAYAPEDDWAKYKAKTGGSVPVKPVMAGPALQDLEAFYDSIHTIANTEARKRRRASQG